MAHNGKTTNSSGWNAVFSWIKYALTGKRDETKAVSQSSVNASSLVDLDARLRALENAFAQGQFGNVEADSLDAPTVKVGGVDVKTKQSVPTFSPDLTKTVSAMSQTANGDLSATFAEVQATVSSQNNYTLPSSKTNLSTIFGKIWNFFGMLLKSTGTWDGTSDSQIPTTAAVQAKLDGKANKVINGNGMLAVIDGNGAYSSSGISAYNQSQINGNVEGKVLPTLQDSSYVSEKDFIYWYSSIQEYFFLDFENKYTSEGFLRLGFSFNGRYLCFRLPVGTANNIWIWEGQYAGDDPAGIVEMYTSVIKNTNGNVATSVFRSSPYLDVFNGTALKRAIDFGSIDLGVSSTNYPSDSLATICMNIHNRISGKMITFSCTFGFTRFAAGAVYTGMIVGHAKVLGYNFNPED